MTKAEILDWLEELRDSLDEGQVTWIEEDEIRLSILRREVTHGNALRRV